MDAILTIPDTLGARLGAEADLPRGALEALVLDAYRAGQLSNPELRELLGLQTRYEMDGFLKAYGVYEEFTLEEIEDQVQAMERLGAISCHDRPDRAAAPLVWQGGSAGRRAGRAERTADPYGGPRLACIVAVLA